MADIPYWNVPGQPQARDFDRVTLDLSRGAMFSTICNIRLGEVWVSRIEARKGLSWREIAYRLAVDINTQRKAKQKDQNALLWKINGGNGTALVSVIVYVGAPSQYHEARRQKALMGLEAAASHAAITYEEMLKIALGATCGRHMGIRRTAIRELRPYPVENWRCTWAIEGMMHVYSDELAGQVEIKIRHIRSAEPGETPGDIKREMRETEGILERNAQAGQESLEIQMRELERQSAKDIKREANQSRHNEEREKYLQSAPRKRDRKVIAHAVESGGSPHTEEVGDNPYDTPWD